MAVTSKTHFGIARKIVSNMTTESWRHIPHVVIMYEADVTELLQEREKLNETITEKSEKISINTIMLRCICEGLKAAPMLNSHLDFSRELVRGCLTCYDHIDISMPMILHTGEMMTINMHDMGNKTLTQMTEALGEVVRRSKQTNVPEVMYDVSIDNTLMWLRRGKVIKSLLKIYGARVGKHRVKVLSGEERKKYYAIPESERLTKHDIEQGTVTVSNLGSVYRGHKGSCAMLEIIPPQTTAFALDAVQRKPVVVTDAEGNESIEIRSIIPITIAFDHRVLDYDHVVPFMERLDEIFEDPSVVQSWK